MKRVGRFHFTIRRNADGLERTGSMAFDKEFDPDDLEGEDFWWLDGNMACDCNRRNEFGLAGGEPVHLDGGCGDDDYTWIRVAIVEPDGTEHVIVDVRDWCADCGAEFTDFHACEKFRGDE
jgi:hypothetical protein